MTPERKSELIRSAAAELKSQWGEVNPEALHALADDLRTAIVDGYGDSLAQAAAHIVRSSDLFGAPSASAEGSLSRADRQQDMERDR
jgi:hypothetical protein